MEINTTQEKMLCERGVIVLPEVIEHETYEQVLALLMLAEDSWTDKPIRLFCAGNGGSAPAAMALADLVRGNSQVVGMLAGIAESSHVTVFAACRERYTFPLAQIGIHRISWSSINSRQDAATLRLRQESLEQLEKQIAVILASASQSSSYDFYWWLDKLQSVGSDECEYYSADWMQLVGFAKPASRFGAADKLAEMVLKGDRPRWKPTNVMSDFGGRSSINFSPFEAIVMDEDKEPTQPLEPIESDGIAEADYSHINTCPFCERHLMLDDSVFTAPDGAWFCNKEHYEYYEFGTNVSEHDDG